MTDERDERQHVLGMPIGQEPHGRQGEEPQHVLGVPTDWYGPVDRTLFRSLAHPVCSWKRWVLRRRPTR